MKKLLAFLRILLIICLCLLLAVNCWLLGRRFLAHDDLPKLAGYCQALVISGSMEPTFSPGDMLIFRERPAYVSGDVVLFRQDSSLVTHRIVGESEGGFLTQGDANNAPDSDLLLPENIEGELVLILPGLGVVVGFLKSPLGVFVLILVGVILFELPNWRGREKSAPGREKK